MTEELKVYCYNRCSTCRNATKWLDAKNIAYKKIDIITENPDYKQLENIYKNSGLPLKKFFNTSGIQYRALGLKDKLSSMSEKDQLDILSTDGRLIKRPLVIGDNFVLLGFKEVEWEEKLNR